MLVNLAGNLVLIWPLGHVGIALSTAAAAWVNAFALWWVLHRRGHFAIDARLRRSALRLVAATVMMVVVLLVLDPLLAPWTSAGLVLRVTALALLLGAAGIAYLAAARLLGIFTLAELRAQFSRKGRGT
jgi:putative peptidoglycan lipid II flippase